MKDKTILAVKWGATWSLVICDGVRNLLPNRSTGNGGPGIYYLQETAVILYDFRFCTVSNAAAVTGRMIINVSWRARRIDWGHIAALFVYYTRPCLNKLTSFHVDSKISQISFQFMHRIYPDTKACSQWTSLGLSTNDISHMLHLPEKCKFSNTFGVISRFWILSNLNKGLFSVCIYICV